MSKWKILGTFTGPVQSLSNGQQSAIQKTAVPRLEIRQGKITGDEVGNLNYHGGDMRVVHHYSEANYRHLKNKFPNITERFVPGSFGENIFTEELEAQDLNIGDVYRLGSAKVQLTVPRRPCATINTTYGDNRILKEVLATGRTGWFYRVLEEGEVKNGDFLEFLERPFPNLPVARLYELGYGPQAFADTDFLQRCWDTGLMDKGWGPKLKLALGL